MQGGNRCKGKTAQTSTNESDSVHASPVILQTYASSSTVSTMSREQWPFCAMNIYYCIDFMCTVSGQLYLCCADIKLCRTNTLILNSRPRPKIYLTRIMAPVPGRLISANPGLKILFNFYILPSYGLLRVTFSNILSLNLEVKAQQSFVSSSYMFLDKKTVLKVVWLNPGLNLTSFKEPGHEP